MKYQKYDKKSYTIHTIKTDKFKNCSIEFVFRNKLVKEKITKLNFLTNLLTYSSKKYPIRKDVVVELENLYNLSFRGVSGRFGEMQYNSFILNFLDPKYCDEGILNEFIDFAKEMLFSPNIVNDEFATNSFKVVKNTMIADIESLKENPTRYAFNRAFNAVDSEGPLSYVMGGNLEDIDTITPSNLYNFYNDFISNSILDIYVVGNLDMEEVVNTISRCIDINTIKNYDIKLDLFLSCRSKVNKVIESSNYEQAKLIMVYNLNDLTDVEKNVVMRVYNYLLGGGSLTTKLGKYLREDNALCYSTSSMYQRFDNILLLYSGIDSKNSELAVKLSKKAVKEMSVADFSDQELDEAKLALISSLKISMDNVGGIVSNYLFNNLADIPMYEEKIKILKSVTKEDIKVLAKKIKLNTIYLLKEGE